MLCGRLLLLREQRGRGRLLLLREQRGRVVHNDLNLVLTLVVTTVRNRVVAVAALHGRLKQVGRETDRSPQLQIGSSGGDIVFHLCGTSLTNVTTSLSSFTAINQKHAFNQ